MRRPVLLALAAAASITLTLPAQVGRQPGMLDPNVATEQELQTVPHITAAIAKAIHDQRPFLSQKDLNDFLAGKSLTKEQLAAVYGKMFVHLNLNTASKEEILMIPGVGNRMLHEFEEYRPYENLARFRREMSKYVKDPEVERLSGYVFVPINLNTASDEDILTIPGMGRRMLHEFKEYRPYDGIERFRKEIGKYVNEKEVARLERYVFVK
jgi:DNA uptake protein ComE-like DNA-binding protein